MKSFDYTTISITPYRGFYLRISLKPPEVHINQIDIPERGKQVIQMKKIYQNIKTVLIWLGLDTEKNEARVIIKSLLTISDFLCQKLSISVLDLRSMSNVYQEIVVKNRQKLPLLNKYKFSSDDV
jgi:hypothetical protein